MSHIVLLEPDRILAQTYQRACQAAGHSLVPCASAQAAILAADQQRPDVIIMELQLVAHSGIEFLYEFRSYSEWQDIPVLIHSFVPPAEFSANWQLFKTQLGVTRYLYKPHTSLRNLLGAVQDLTVAIIPA